MALTVLYVCFMILSMQRELLNNVSDYLFWRVISTEQENSNDEYVQPALGRLTSLAN